MMDVLTSLTFFDRFHAHHREKCNVKNLDVEMTRGDTSTFVTLTCPGCGYKISGTLRDEDMPQVVQLLDAKRAS